LSGGHEFAGASDLVISPELRKIFPFCVECKHRKNFRLEHAFLPAKDFISYHDQVRDACKKENYTRAPMIVIRGQGGAVYVCLQEIDMKTVGVVDLYRIPLVEYPYGLYRWVMMRFDDLLERFKLMSNKAA
jgi:hypothetical protein